MDSAIRNKTHIEFYRVRKSENNPTLPVNVKDSAGTRVTLPVEDVELTFRWWPVGGFQMVASKDAEKEYGDRFVPQCLVNISARFWLQETEEDKGSRTRICRNSESSPRTLSSFIEGPQMHRNNAGH